MRVLGIYLLHVSPSNVTAAEPGKTTQPNPGSMTRTLCSSVDVSHIGWFQRSAVQQVMAFTAKTVAERTAAGQRQTIDEQDYTAYVFRSRSHADLVAVCVTDKDYPSRAAACICPRVIEEFVVAFPRYADPSTNTNTWTPTLEERMRSYNQSPDNALDQVGLVQKELSETTEIMHKNIEAVLQRGEQLDSLLIRTQELDASAKLFVKSAKKANKSCCSIQ